MTGGAGEAAPDTSVAARYDGMMMLLGELSGGDLHEGYWESPSDRSTLEEASRRLTDIMAGKLRVTSGDRVLDIGCALGGPSIRLAQATGATVVGITNSPAQVARAAERARAAGVDDLVTFRCADAMDLPFEPESFDAAWMIESIFAMPDRLPVLRQAARVLRPGGRLTLTDILDRSEGPEALEKAMAALDEHTAAHGLPRTILLPIRLERYEPLLKEAGLVPAEITDISAHTVAQTLACLRAKLADDRERLVAACGSEVVDLYASGLPLIEAIGWGYGLIVAAAPGA